MVRISGDTRRFKHIAALKAIDSITQTHTNSAQEQAHRIVITALLRCSGCLDVHILRSLVDLYTKDD